MTSRRHNLTPPTSPATLRGCMGGLCLGHARLWQAVITGPAALPTAAEQGGSLLPKRYPSSFMDIGSQANR